MLFNDRRVQLGFLGITTRVLSKLHVQIWPVCDSILSQLISHQGFPCIPCIFGVCSCLSEYLVPLWSVLMCFRMMVAGCGVHFYNSNSAQWWAVVSIEWLPCLTIPNTPVLRPSARKFESVLVAALLLNYRWNTFTNVTNTPQKTNWWPELIILDLEGPKRMESVVAEECENWAVQCFPALLLSPLAKWTFLRFRFYRIWSCLPVLS